MSHDPLAALKALGDAAKARIDALAEAEKKGANLIYKANAKVKAAKTIEARDLAREELRAATADAARLVDALMWEPTSLVYRIVHWTCTCAEDMEQEEPLGLFTRFEHRKGYGQKFVAVKPGDTWPNLPRQIERLERTTHLCPYCIKDHGFLEEGEEPEVETPEESPWSTTSLVEFAIEEMGGGWLPGEEVLLRESLTAAYAASSSEESDDDEDEEEELPPHLNPEFVSNMEEHF